MACSYATRACTFLLSSYVYILTLWSIEEILFSFSFFPIRHPSKTNSLSIFIIASKHSWNSSRYTKATCNLDKYRLDCIRYKNVLPSIARHLCYIIIRAEQSARTALVKTWINVPFISFSSFQTKYWNFRRPWFFLSKRSLRLPSFEETVEKGTINGDWCLSNPHDVIPSWRIILGIRAQIFYRTGTFSSEKVHGKPNKEKKYEILWEFFLNNFRWGLRSRNRIPPVYL